MAHVTILGAGMMGTATAFPLAERGHAVDLVGTHLDDAIVEAIERDRVHPRLAVAVPESVRVAKLSGLSGALERADAVVLGVSSAGVSWAAETLGRALPKTLPIAMVTKGLEAAGGELAILPDRLRDGLPEAVRVEPVMIGGPCIAGELARRTPSTVVPSSRAPGAAQAYARLAGGPFYRAVVDDDVVGVCGCAAFKNAYAVAVGVAAGLHGTNGPAGPVAYHNLEASTFARALGEMARLVEALGGRRDTAFGLAGAGDLFVTCQGGRSTRLGRLLGQGRTLAQAREELSAPNAPVTLEGVDVTSIVFDALPPSITRADVPILDRLRAILFEGAAGSTMVSVG